MLLRQQNSLDYFIASQKPFEDAKYYLFGSSAKQQENYDSDVDIVAFVNAEKTAQNIRKAREWKAELRGMYPPNKYSEIDLKVYFNDSINNSKGSCHKPKDASSQNDWFKNDRFKDDWFLNNIKPDLIEII